MDGLRNSFFFDQLMHRPNGLLCAATQLISEFHYSSTSALGVEDSPTGNIPSEHFFKAQSLSTKLSVIIVELAAFADFELNRHQSAFGMTLDYIALPAEPEPFRPHGQSAE